MDKKITGILAIVFCVILIGSVFLYSSLKDKIDPLEQKEKTSSTTESSESSSKSDDLEDDVMMAVDFEVSDYEGNKVTLLENLGKPMVVNFWASWCPPCKMEMPYFEEAYKEIGDEVTFMMIDMVDGNRETAEKGNKYVTDEGYTFPVYYDREMIAAYTYGVYSLPSTLFINKDGYITGAHVGAMDKKKLLNYIEGAKKEKEVLVTKENPAQCEAKYMKITPKNAKELMATLDDYRIIDVRTKDEYNSGYINGAEWIEDKDVVSIMSEKFPDKGEPLFIYCRSGRRSASIAQLLVSEGYYQVYDMGGIMDWSYKEDIVKP